MRNKYFIFIFVIYVALFSCSKGKESQSSAKASQSESQAQDQSQVKDQTKDQSTDESLSGKTIQAVTENGYVPLNFLDPETGKGIGLEYDLVNEIAKRLKLNIVWNLSSWDTMINSVKEGQFDVGMDGITITEERAKEIDFSIPYIKSEQFMLVRSDENRFDSTDSFAKNENLTAGTQVGTTQFYVIVNDVLDGNEENPRIRSFDNFAFAVQALLSGDVDMVLMDKVSTEGYIGANAGKLKTIGNAIGEEEFGLIFTKGSVFLKAFNEKIEEMKKDGTLADLQKKWFYKYEIKN